MEAFITLATNDSYCLGACTLAYSLRRSGTTRQLAVMITSSVSEDMRKVLAKVFDHVEMVDLLHSGDPANLKLMDRQDLGGTFTKLHCWKMTQYSKAVFMDADTLVIRNIDDIFEREEFSAAPDPGWPDCFNSGVFVFRPSIETYGKLLDFAVEQGSFDGADQGLLNRFFSDWATKDIARHLPFLYNCSMWEFYSYLPALREFRPQVRVVHFIGPVKPWHQSVQDSGHSDERSVYKNDFLRQWWGAFAAGVQPLFSTELRSKYVPTTKQETVDPKTYSSSSTLDGISRVAIKFPEPIVEITRSPHPRPPRLEEHKLPDDGPKPSDPAIPAVKKGPEMIKDGDHLSVGAVSGDSTPVSSASAYSYESSEKLATPSPDSAPSPIHVAKLVEKIADNVGALYLESRYEQSHREAWERGQIDYLGVDRFDNILARLNESIKVKDPGKPKLPRARSKSPRLPRGARAKTKPGKASKDSHRRPDDHQTDDEISSLSWRKE